MIGAVCSLAAIVVLGVSTNRLSLISTGTSMINRVDIDGHILLSNEGVFNKDITLPKTLSMVRYNYYGNGCNSSGMAAIPPLTSCQVIPQCTMCVENYNYQRCDGENKMYYDVTLMLTIIIVTYLFLWLIIPMLSLLLAVVKPNGSNGLFRRYMIYAALISGSKVDAQCTVTGPVADPVPVHRIANLSSLSLDSTSECVSFRYIDDLNNFRNIEICYSRYTFESNLEPIYDFATGLTTTSSVETDWTEFPNPSTTYAYTPNGAQGNSTMNMGNVGTLTVSNNDICCHAQQCRTNQMCLSETSYLQVDGVATMMKPTGWTGKTDVLIKSYLEGGNSTDTCITLVGPSTYTLKKDGLTMVLSTDNQFSDDSKQYDLTESTVIYDRFSVLGAQNLYIGDYPEYIMQPYDDQCDQSPSRPITRTVLVNSCGDLNTYGLIDNRIIYSRLKRFMYYSIYLLQKGDPGFRGNDNGPFSQLRTEFSKENAVTGGSAEQTNYLKSDYNNMPIGSYVLMDSKLSSNMNDDDGINSRWDMHVYIDMVTQMYWTEDFARGLSLDVLDYACNYIGCMWRSYQYNDGHNCLIASCQTRNLQTYNVMHTLYGGTVKENIFNECNARYVRFVNQHEWNSCIMELTAMTACLSAPIQYSSLDILSICLYSVTQIDFIALSQSFRFPMSDTSYLCKNCKINSEGKRYHINSPVTTESGIRAVKLVTNGSSCALGLVPPTDNLQQFSPFTYPDTWKVFEYSGSVVDNFEGFYDTGWIAATTLSMVADIFQPSLRAYVAGKGVDCTTNVSLPCSMRSLGRLFTQCASECYKCLSFPYENPTYPPPATSTTSLYFTDDTSPGCLVSPTNVRLETKLKCSFYPEYRWSYTLQGTPQTTGMIPPTIVQSSCISPMSDGCWASLGSNLGQSDGTVQTLIFTGNMPPNTNSIDDVYPSVSYTVDAANKITISSSEFYGSGSYINVPSLNIQINSRNPVTESSAGYATYLNILSAAYVVGDVNDDVTFTLSANYGSAGVIGFTQTQTGSSMMNDQFCYIDKDYNCTLYALCTDTPCSIAINAMDTNTSLNTYIVAVFNVPEACRDCNQGGQTSQRDIDEIGQGCFLICWNFSGFGGFLGALIEWAVIVFVLLIGLSLVCIIPKVYNDIRPKRA